METSLFAFQFLSKSVDLYEWVLRLVPGKRSVVNTSLRDFQFLFYDIKFTSIWYIIYKVIKIE